MSLEVSTKDRILNIAEELFARQGFAETSLRAITGGAEVNVASVNYHFGSKKSLIESVFERFMDCFTQALIKEMLRLERQPEKIQVYSVLNALVKPLIKMDSIRPDGASVFMRLLSRAYAETQGHIRRFATTRYSHVFSQFVALLHQASPQLPPSEMFWRLHFMLGSFIFTFAGHEALEAISESDFKEKVTVEQILVRLIPFLSAGFSNSKSFNQHLPSEEA